MKLFGILRQVKNFQEIKTVYILSIISILVTFFLAFIGFLILHNVSGGFFEIWNRWDTVHYLNIAQNWYQSDGEGRFSIVFLPLYPFIIKIFSLFSENYLLNALLVSNLFYFLALIFLYKLAIEDFSKKIARRAIFYLTIFPTAYFLHAGYTESIFLALVVSSFYYARKERWFFSALLGLLASLTRITGVILAPVLLIEYLAQRRFQLKEIKRNIFFLTIVPFGSLLYLFVNYLVFGNAFQFLIFLKEHWYKSFSLPWKGLFGAFDGLFWRSPSEKVMVAGSEFFFALLGLFLIAFVFKYLRLSYAVYSLIYWLMIASTSFWLSIPRYTLSIFPIFIILAIFGKNRGLDYLITILSLMLQTIFLLAFVRGYWAF